MKGKRKERAGLLRRARRFLARRLDPFPSDPRRLIASVASSVVALDSVRRIVGGTRADPPWEDPDRPGCGSGVAVGAGGLILTAAHIPGGETALWAKDDRGAPIPAHYHAHDREADLEVLVPDRRAPGPADLDLARVPGVGEPLLLLGRRTCGSLAGGGVAVAAVHLGVRIAPHARSWNLIQLDRPLPAATDGAPLFDGGGRVVAVATMDVPAEGRGGFAIPLAPWADVVRSILRGRMVDRPYLGIAGHNQWIEGRRRRGVLVTHVDPRGGAAAAGVRPFDTIVRVEGRAVEDLGELQERVRRAPVGAALILEVLRGDRLLGLPVRLGSTLARSRVLRPTGRSA